MTLPVRQPTNECVLCDIINEGLDVLMRMTKTLEPVAGESPELHILAAIAGWWTVNSLAVNDNDPVALFRCIAAALREAGHPVNVADLGPVDIASPAANRN